MFDAHTQHHYTIRVAGLIDPSWSWWFDDMSIAHVKSSTNPTKNNAVVSHTILHGAVEDQAALYGLLIKLRDLGLPLLAVQCEDIG